MLGKIWAQALAGVGTATPEAAKGANKRFFTVEIFLSRRILEKSLPIVLFYSRKSVGLMLAVAGGKLVAPFSSSSFPNKRMYVVGIVRSSFVCKGGLK